MTWAVRKKEQDLLERTEMRMLRWILGVFLSERLRNEEIRKLAGVVCITEKIKEARLRWYGHVVRSNEECAIKKVWKEPVRGKRSRGRQKLRWRDVIAMDMNKKAVTEKDTGDKKEWRKIQATDP